MRSRSLALLVALFALIPAAVFGAVAAASPSDEYSGTHFGDGNLPAGCIRDMSADNPDNICHHIRTDMNGLDSPQVDVLIMVPVSPTAERDMRLMRQAIEMWEGGIDYLASEMGLDWLATGMDFHVSVDYIDLEGGSGSEFTTYPIVDPEVVVIATNPVGGAGIGIDPIDATFTDEDLVPCHTVPNPFDFEYWENLPGFDNHHERGTGTYVEDCGGAGGNICFAINGAIDPAPDVVDVFNLFDLVSHEVGHCLTIGHVGDGLEATWGALPSNDIMAYSQDPPGLNKCVSTLDVEGIAPRMSKYIDVNGDGVVDASDQLFANDGEGDGSNPFQVQHPHDHLYASSTGSPLDCPQPDLGLAPGTERTDWTPEPVDTTTPELAITSPADGTSSTASTVDVTGTVARVPLTDGPTDPFGSYDDADDDASSSMTEIQSLDATVTASHVDATIQLADIWPSTSVASPTSYSVLIDGHRFDSFIRYAVDENPMTWDASAAGYMPTGASSWDLAAKTVSFHIPRELLAEAPYGVIGQANVGSLSALVVDDRAPDSGTGIGVTGASIVDPGDAAATTSADAAAATRGEQVQLFVDGVAVATQAVTTADGPASFSLPTEISEGTHVLQVEWQRNGEVLATRGITVTREPAATTPPPKKKPKPPKK